MGPSGMGANLTSGTSATPDPASSSIMKSKKPDWRKGGKAQHAVTRSRERQADLMVLLAGSLEDERGHSSKVWVDTFSKQSVYD